MTNQSHLAISLTLLVAGTFSVANAAIAEGTKTVLVLVDTSASTGKDHIGYRRDLRVVVDSLGFGDRIVVSTINAETLTGFAPAIDRTFPPAAVHAEPQWGGLLDNKLRREREIREADEATEAALADARKVLDDEVAAFWNASKPSPHTAVLDSLLVAEKLLSKQPGRRVVVFFSDMIESSERFDFEKMTLTAAKIAEIVEADRKGDALPRLDGIRVFVAGATASSATKAKQVEDFWEEYFQACEADFDRSRYSHALINYAE